MTARFDSSGYVRRLEEVGVERRVAEAQAEVVRDYILAEVATKDDIERLRMEVMTDHRRLEERLDGLEQRMDSKFDGLEQRVDGRLEGLEQRMDGKLEGLEQRMTIKLGGMLIVAVGALLALERLLA